jgi:hypothetical protein
VSNTIWNLGYLHAQSNVKDGVKVLGDIYKWMSKKSPHAKSIMQLLPHIEACDGSEMWGSIEIQNVILEQAKRYLKTCEQASAYGKVDTHVAVHVRRGDYKMFNCDKIVNNPSVSYEKQLAVQELWSDADAHVQVLVEKIKHKTKIQNQIKISNKSTPQQMRRPQTQNISFMNLAGANGIAALPMTKQNIH